MQTFVCGCLSLETDRTLLQNTTLLLCETFYLQDEPNSVGDGVALMGSKKMIILFLAFTSLLVILALPEVHADPVNVSWLILDQNGHPLDGASVTIYYSQSTSGPFIPVPANDLATNTYVKDLIADQNVRRNPIISGPWNSQYPKGIAFADVHVTQLSKWYFYIKINYGSLLGYWPLATSTKPDNPGWAPVVASTPSGYAAEGNGIGTGPSTAYLAPSLVIPFIPLGPLAAASSMIVISGLYVKFRKRKTNSSSQSPD